ncbi:MAG: Sua5/YciO/YrdC/YwlC family protein [Myxococcota bacterium]
MATNDTGRVYELLVDGGVALVPTIAGYGLVAMRSGAVERIYALKGRPATKPCITVSTWPIFDEVVGGVEPALRSWLVDTTSWAPLAVVGAIAPGSRLVAGMEPFVRAQCTSDGTIALFHNAGTLVTAVAERAFVDGRLVVGSSANRSGAGNSYTLADVPPEMRAGVDLVIDVGSIPRTDDRPLATTLLDLTRQRFLRQGIAFDRIERAWQAHLAAV